MTRDTPPTSVPPPVFAATDPLDLSGEAETEGRGGVEWTSYWTDGKTWRPGRPRPGVSGTVGVGTNGRSVTSVPVPLT